MKRSSIIGTILLILLTLVPAASALVAVARTRQVLSAGGALVSNGGITIASTVGQPIAGSSTAGGVKLGHGFWGPHFGGFSVHLPLMLRNYVPSLPYFEGPLEAEPNNSCKDANGPLQSGRVYRGYSNNDGFPDYNKDYFSFYMNTPGSIRVIMNNHPGGEPELQLLYQCARVKRCQGASCEVSYDGKPGSYYIYITAAPPYNTTISYTLQVTYP